MPDELKTTGLPSVEASGIEMVALVWGLRIPVNEKPSLPDGLMLGKSDMEAVRAMLVIDEDVRLIHCHEVLLAVWKSDSTASPPVEAPVFVRV